MCCCSVIGCEGGCDYIDREGLLLLVMYMYIYIPSCDMKSDAERQHAGALNVPRPSEGNNCSAQTPTANQPNHISGSSRGSSRRAAVCARMVEDCSVCIYIDIYIHIHDNTRSHANRIRNARLYTSLKRARSHLTLARKHRAAWRVSSVDVM